MIVKQTDEVTVKASYEDCGAYKVYRFENTDHVGIHAEMNSGSYLSVVETIFIFPESVKHIIDDDMNCQEFDLDDWHDNEWEWEEGRDEHLTEVFDKYIDL